MSRVPFKNIILTFSILLAFCLISIELAHLTLADIYASVAKQKLSANRYDTALLYLEQALVQNASDPEYQVLRAQLFYARAQETQDLVSSLNFLRAAKAGFQKSLDGNPGEGNVWLELAQTCWWLGRFDGYREELARAESSFLQAVATDPNNGKFLYALANYYLSSDRADESAPYLTRLALVYAHAYTTLRSHPQWSPKAREQFKAGLQTAMANDLTAQNASSVLAVMAVEEKDWQSAAVYTQEFIRRQGASASPQPHLDLGLYFLQLAEWDQARTSLHQGLKLSKKRERVLEDLLTPSLQAGAFSLYLDLCHDTASFDAGVRNKLAFILAKAYLAADNPEAAEAYLRQSLQIQERAEAHRYLAEIALKRNDWDTMELESQRATVLDPANSSYYGLLARALEAQKKYASALEAIERAISNAPQPQEGNFELQGALFWALKDYAGAIRAWSTAHQLGPENARHLRRIAEAYWKLYDFARAEQYYLAALERSPGDEQLRRALDQLRKEHHP